MNYKHFFTLMICLLLLVSVVPPAFMQQSLTGFNWYHPGYDDSVSYFNPQNALNKDNVIHLEQDWMFPLNSEAKVHGNETSRTTSHPLMANGIVYIIDRFQLLMGLDSQEARIHWASQLSTPEPTSFGLEYYDVHSRHLNYFDGGIWVIDLDCSIKGYGATNGALLNEIPPNVLCGGIPAEAIPRETMFRSISSPVFYEKERIIIAAPSGFETMGGTLSYIMGISVDTGQTVWKTSLTESAQENLVLGMGPWPIDQDKGIVYIGTGSPTPEWNATRRPGANLYSNSIIALDTSTGEILWQYQTIPHDLNGYGCTGNLVLGENDGQQMVYGACRNGYLYALDAETGDLVWYFDPPSVKRMNSENANFVVTNNYDPSKPWLNYPSTDPAVQCPGVFGAVSSNIVLAYDTVYVSTFNRCSRVEVAPVVNVGDNGVMAIKDLGTPVGPVNSTVYAVDASTGEVKWNHFFDGFALKGGLTVSGGVLYVPSPDGSLYAIDASIGSEVWKRSFGLLGSAIPTLVGANAYGNWTLIQIVAGTPVLDFDVERSTGFLFKFSIPWEFVATTSETISPAADNLGYTIYAVVAVAIVLMIATMIFYLRKSR